VKEWLDTNRKAVMGQEYSATEDIEVGVPTNPALTSLPNAMNVAHENYISKYSPSIPTVVLFVVQEGETNTVDQRMLEFQLWNNHKVPVVRMSLTKAKSQLKMDEATGALYILPDVSEDGSVGSIPTKYEVSLVYFRAGYAPTDYPDGYDGIEWDSRETIERSRATKCPNLG
jgi:glutathione synthase